MKRFGFVKFQTKPKTDQDWSRIYGRNKLEVPSIKKLSLTFSSKGAGQTGARHFKAYAIPPLKYWNPNMNISVKLIEEANIEPTLGVEFTSGESQTINLKGIHVDQIKANLVTLDSTKRASATSSSSSL